MAVANIPSEISVGQVSGAVQPIFGPCHSSLCTIRVTFGPLVECTVLEGVGESNISAIEGNHCEKIYLEGK